MRNRTENQIELFLIRHGETASNQEHRYLGWTEEPLSSVGKQQLEELKEQGIYPDPEDISLLFVSPMLRCRETAQWLFGKKEQIVIPEFKEIHFGLFEGKNYLDLQGNEQYQAWIDSNGTLPFPEGESREEFCSRCNRGFVRMLQICKQQEERIRNADEKEPPRLKIAAVVHGGTMMAVLSSFLQGSYYDFQVGNGEGYRCEITVPEQEEVPLFSDIRKLI